MPIVYTRGEIEEVSESEGEILWAAGLVQLQPGSNGLYKLSPTATWSAVRRVLDRLRES